MLGVDAEDGFGVRNASAIKTFTSKGLLIGCLAAGAVWQAQADPGVPPWWTSGAPDTTYLDTGFPNDHSPAAPETFTNPNGPPTIYASGSWSPMADNHLGVWDISGGGYLQVNDPNYGNAYNEVFLQMVYSGAGAYQPDITVNGEAGTLVSHQNLTGLGNWEYGQWSFTLNSNPSSELVEITGNVKIDQLTIDTHIIPEPGTGVLALLGGALLLVARRRRQG
jgi:hypothetical protein